MCTMSAADQKRRKWFDARAMAGLIYLPCPGKGLSVLRARGCLEGVCQGPRKAKIESSWKCEASD